MTRLPYRRIGAFCLLLAISALLASAQDYGVTSFENSGAERAQEDFLRGILMLHSFEYEDARESFAAARRADPGFAMAYWGEAMTYNHPVWFNQDRHAAGGVLQELGASLEDRLAGAPTRREKDYIRAVHVLFGDGSKEERDHAYAEEMRRLSEIYPEDLDAMAFYALAILGTSHGGRDFATYMKAAAVAEEVFDANPRHPGAAHYLIHSYDDPVHAPLGLRPARAYAQIAPAAAHARHMPSHIFVALGMWDDVVAANEASWASSEERIRARSLGVDARGYHALQWLTYGYLQQGRYEDAARLVDTMEESFRQSGSGRTAYHMTVIRAAYLVETENWKSRAAQISVDTGKMGLEGASIELFARGLTGLRTGDENAAIQAAREIRTQTPVDSDDNTSKRAEAGALQLEGLVAHARGDVNQAISLLRDAANIVDSLPMDYGPPYPVKPVHELLGDVLLAEGLFEEAEGEYAKALEYSPGRARSLLGLRRAAARAGKNDAAGVAERTLLDIWKRADTEALSALDEPSTRSD